MISLLEIAFKRGDRAIRTRGSVFMVFPYLDHDLSGILENRDIKLTVPQIKCYMLQLLQATDYLHKNRILHRDMKSIYSNKSF